MTVCCACLFLHLVYYLTGYYIRLLQHGLLSNTSNGWVSVGNISAPKTNAIYIRLWLVYYHFTT